MKVKLVNEDFKDNYLRNLLFSRGVENVEEFLDPPDKYLLSPLLFDNIERGAQWLKETLDKKDSKILIVVDSDVDGFTSGAIMYNFIHTITPEQSLKFILHEHKQHGLQDHIQILMDSDVVYDLIILPDSSSNDYEYHEKLGQRGTRCLVLDHHEIDDNQQISDYACIINNQLSNRYTNKDLTGAGVAWQFCRYYDSVYTSYITTPHLIDLAALGVCGDMGSVLSMENRYIMKNGFNNIYNYFFLSIIRKQGYSITGKMNPTDEEIIKALNSTKVAFYVVPMMNAMIRVGSQEEKERLFLALIDGHRLVPCNKRGAKGTMEEVAIESLRECANAKAKQGRITDQMVSKLEQKIFKYDLLENKILFVRLEDDDDFPTEINGLIAMKLCAKYKHPTIIARLNTDGYDRGSLRNNNNCELEDFKSFLNESGFFEYAQGHANAAGCSIKDNNLRSFHEYANEKLKDINFNEMSYDVNFIKNWTDADLEAMIFELASYPELWGQNNNEPLIYIKDIYISKGDIQIMGAKSDTVKIERNGVSLIKFHAYDMIEELNSCNEIRLSIVGKPNINEWMGHQNAQIFIENYEVKDDLLEF